MKKWERMVHVRDSQILNSGEKFVAMVIVTHWNQENNQARIRRDTLIKDTGFSARTLQKHLGSLCKENRVFRRTRTGRAAIFRPGLFFSDYIDNRIVETAKIAESEYAKIAESDSVYRTDHLIGRWEEGRFLREAKASNWTNDDVNWYS